MTYRKMSSFSSAFWQLHIVHFLDDGKFSYVQYSHSHFFVLDIFLCYLFWITLPLIAIFLLILNDDDKKQKLLSLKEPVYGTLYNYNIFKMNYVYESPLEGKKQWTFVDLYTGYSTQ